MIEVWPSDEQVARAEEELAAERTAAELREQMSTCCCGSEIIGHARFDGHAPVSMWDNDVFSRASEIAMKEKTDG